MASFFRGVWRRNIWRRRRKWHPDANSGSRHMSSLAIAFSGFEKHIFVPERTVRILAALPLDNIPKSYQWVKLSGLHKGRNIGDRLSYIRI